MENGLCEKIVSLQWALSTYIANGLWKICKPTRRMSSIRSSQTPLKIYTYQVLSTYPEIELNVCQPTLSLRMNSYQVLTPSIGDEVCQCTWRTKAYQVPSTYHKWTWSNSDKLYRDQLFQVLSNNAQNQINYMLWRTITSSFIQPMHANTYFSFPALSTDEFSIKRPSIKSNLVPNFRPWVLKFGMNLAMFMVTTLNLPGPKIPLHPDCYSPTDIGNFFCATLSTSSNVNELHWHVSINFHSLELNGLILVIKHRW